MKHRMKKKSLPKPKRPLEPDELLQKAKELFPPVPVVPSSKERIAKLIPYGHIYDYLYIEANFSHANVAKFFRKHVVNDSDWIFRQSYIRWKELRDDNLKKKCMERYVPEEPKSIETA